MPTWSDEYADYNDRAAKVYASALLRILQDVQTGEATAEKAAAYAEQALLAVGPPPQHPLDE